jgi:hypothetical protein
VCVQERKRERVQERKRERKKKQREYKGFYYYFLNKNEFPPKNKNKKITKCPVSRAQGWGDLLPC